MKNILLIALMIFCANTYAQVTHPNDTVKIGKGSSASDKGIIFETEDGVNNKRLVIEKTSKKLKYSGNELQVGDGLDSDKKFIFSTDTATKPFIGWSDAQQSLIFSNDGILEKKFGSGTGGGSGGFNNLDNAGFEDGFTVNWSCSAGDCTEETTAPLFAEKSINFTATATSDFLQSRVFYKGGDANLDLKVVNGDAEVLAQKTLVTHNIANHESLFFRCPTKAAIDLDSDKGDLRLVVEATDASVLTVFDDMYLGSLIGLVSAKTTAKQFYKISQAASAMTDRALELQYTLGTATISDEFEQLIVAENDIPNTRTKFVAQEDLSVTVALTAPRAADRAVGVTKNGTLLHCGNQIGGGSGTLSLQQKMIFLQLHHVLMLQSPTQFLLLPVQWF